MALEGRLYSGLTRGWQGLIEDWDRDGWWGLIGGWVLEGWVVGGMDWGLVRAIGHVDGAFGDNTGGVLNPVSGAEFLRHRGWRDAVLSGELRSGEPRVSGEDDSRLTYLTYVPET